MTRAQAIARVRATCGSWWPQRREVFHESRQGRFRCLALEGAVIYAWHADHRIDMDLTESVIGAVQEAERCAQTCKVCEKHERLAPAPKEAA